MIGKTLGHYRVLEQLGSGGMGVVYRARDERLDRDVALKVLPGGALADEDARKRFRKEALALSKLNQPNIATVHDFGSQEGVDYLVMELVEGETLAHRIESGALAEKEIAALGSQVADALEEAHENGVIHRDLKPSNIMVTPKGRAKVLDFGLAKLLRPAAQRDVTASLTATPAAAGTLPYMPPEQLQGETVDARSDLYALGAVLYEMATAQRPFREELSSRLIDAILHQPPVSPRALNARILPELERIILKCLEKSPDQRYQSAREVGVDLRRIGTFGSTPAAIPPARTSAGRWIAAAAATGAVILAAALFAINVGGLRDRYFRGSPSVRIGSLAVLPLNNFSRDPEQEYFADGMTEELITDLAKIGALKVISRTSVMQYKGTKKTLPEIARELNVDGVVEGSVQRSGDRVRITAQLIEARTDRHIWAESYERDLRDVLGLQGEVASAIAREIQVTLTPQEQTQLASARPVNPEAHEALLQGNYYWNKLTEAGIRKSMDYYQKAIQLTPDYAPAYSALAFSYNLLASSEYAPSQENYAQAKKLAQKAIELDGNFAGGHAALGFVLSYGDWNWSAAEAEFKRANELDPNGEGAHSVYALYLGEMGRGEEAIAEMKRSLELDPLNVLSRENLAWLYYQAGHPEQAVAEYQKLLEMDANSADAHAGLGQVYESQGKHAEAIAESREALKLAKDIPAYLANLGCAYAVAGKKNEAQKVLGELEQMSKRIYVSPYYMARVYAGLGEKEQCFRWLEKALDEHSDSLVSLKVDPTFASLRSDPRFHDLLRRIGLPE
jgi:serine/threonine-protein kinase